MKIDIEADGIEFDNQLSHFASCCAAFELGPQRSQVDSLRIRLRKAGRSEDPKQRWCLVEVDLSDGNTIVAQDADIDLHIAIYRALEHAAWMCARWLSEEQRDDVDLPLLRTSAPVTGETSWAA